VSRSFLHLRLGGANARGRSEAVAALLSEFCRRITPIWELDPDGAYLDLTGTGRLYGRGVEGAAHVTRLARDIGDVVAAGTAPTRLAAWLASLTAARAGGGIFAVLPAQVAVFLQSYPVDFLPGRRSVINRLHQLGIRTFGDLQIVPRALLLSVFGKNGSLLADQACGKTTGLSAAGTRSPAGAPNILELAVGVRLARPVSSEQVGSALCRGLAVRALSLGPGGPVSRGKWRLTARWSTGSCGSSLVRGPESHGWKSWLRLVEMLWSRLPQRRQGLVGLELWSEFPGGYSCPQGNLFPDDEADCRLANVLRLSRRESAAPLGSACEDLLVARGAVWYGPGGGLSKPGQGFG